jgi:hypothetical protein
LCRVSGQRHLRSAKCSLASGKLECNLLCQPMYTSTFHLVFCQVLATTAHEFVKSRALAVVQTCSFRAGQKF